MLSLQKFIILTTQTLDEMAVNGIVDPTVETVQRPLTR